jgi:hypothetical protein
MDMPEIRALYNYVRQEGEEERLIAVEPRDEHQSRARFELAERIRITVVSDKKRILTQDDRSELCVSCSQLFSFDELPKHLQDKIKRVEHNLAEQITIDGITMQEYLFAIQP